MDDSLDTRRLRMFVVVANLGSMRKAADELGLTPSALSHGVRALEDELGTTLFERMSSGLVLTASGQTLLTAARDLVVRLDEAIADFRGGKRWEESQLRIGVTDTACRYLIPAVVREFRESFPNTSLKLEVATAERLVERMNEGYLDLAIAPLGIDYPDFEQIGLGTDELVFVVHPLHPWTEMEAVGVGEIARERLILPTPRSPVYRCVEEYYRNERMRLKPFIELDDEEAVKRLVMLDIGVGILPSWVAKKEIERGTLRTIPLGGKVLSRRWEVFRRSARQPGFGTTLFIGVSRAVSKDILTG